MPDGRVPPLHLITDDATLREPGFAARAEEALLAGGRSVALHLRGPTTSPRLLLELARRLVPVAGAAGGWVLVNDRVDVAMAGGARGVHLASRSMRATDARRLLGSDAWIGVSVHRVEEGEDAARQGADYLLAGTLFATPSHPGRRGTGTEWLRSLAAAGRPVIGIGGVTPERVRPVLDAGAAGVAVLRGVWAAGRAGPAVMEYLQALNGERNSE